MMTTQPLSRIQRYEDLGLGLFIHWGLYSQLACGEWTELLHQRPQAEYERLQATFTAADFDARAIVQAAKQMGARYIVLTTKHHEGFFLYDTRGLSSFDAMHAPAHRNLIREFVDACREADITPFFYMATYDWHSPLYENDFPAYLDYLQASVEVLAKNYGPVGGFWFDGNWHQKNADWHLDALYGMIRRYQPEAIIVNNTGLKNRGRVSHPEVDVVTYERHTPDMVNHGEDGQKYVAAEVSMTLNQHWGHAQADLNFKSPATVIESVAHARRIGANILVNIGLTGAGAIPPLSRAYMAVLGQWTQMATPVLYTGRPQPAVRSNGHPRDFALHTHAAMYLFIHDLGVVGNDNVVLGGEGPNLRSFTGIARPIRQVRWLDDDQPVAYMQDQARGFVTIDANGYTYGTNWVVRIAKVTFA